MRSSCVSPKDFKATAPESKQHPASCTRANSQWREKRSSEKIRKRDLSLLVVGNVLANDSDSMQTCTSAAKRTVSFIQESIRGCPDLSSGNCAHARAHDRLDRGISFSLFFFFFSFETQSSCVLCSVRYKRSLFPPHAEWRARYTDIRKYRMYI